MLVNAMMRTVAHLNESLRFVWVSTMRRRDFLLQKRVISLRNQHNGEFKGMVVCALKLFTILIFSLQPICAFAESESVVIPYTIENGGHYIVEVTTNDRLKLKFIVDTAAQNTSLYPVGVTLLGLRPKQNRSTYVQGANGRIRADVYHMDSINIGAARMENFDVAVAPLPKKDENQYGGILGLDFLSQYTIEFECLGQKLLLHKTGSDRSLEFEDVDHAVFRRHIYGFMLLDMKLNGAHVVTVLDTGARRNVLSWKAAEAAGVTRETLGLVEDEPIVGATGREYRRTLKTTFNEVQIGQQLWFDQPFTIADIDVFKALRLTNEKAAIIGPTMLAGKHYIIDFERKRVAFVNGQEKCLAPGSGGQEGVQGGAGL